MYKKEQGSARQLGQCCWSIDNWQKIKLRSAYNNYYVSYSEILLEFWQYFLPLMRFGIALAPASGRGALTPINQNAIKQGKCGNLECGQTERGKSERDKAHISVDPDFAQTDFAPTELAKTMFCKSGIP
jgi:hypothetical protein